MDFKFKVAELIKASTTIELEIEAIASLIEVPKHKTHGDYAFPCFGLAKSLRKAPHIIATELSREIKGALVESIEPVGPYINFHLNREYVSKEILKKILSDSENYGNVERGNGEKITIDFSSPNIAKPFSMGHLRSTMIGNSLALIAEKCGYESVRINHIGDWGTQFGKLIVAFKNWGDEEKVKQNPIKELFTLYTLFHEKADEDEGLNDEARAWFKRLEDGDEEARRLWKWFRDESLKEFEKIYTLLGVHFSSNQGEAFYNDKMEQVIDLLAEKNLLVTSDGAEVVELEALELPPCLIKKSDGATLYATRDLAAAMYRQETYQFEKAFYVVGNEQTLHFKQVIAVLKKLGFDWANEMVHIPFGMILKDGKKMSTRKGKVVLLEEVLNETISSAKRIILEKNPNLENKDKVAEQVGVGAVVFHDLKNFRMNDIEFSIDEMLKFEGETGPYVQYTHARACSILRKAGYNSSEGDFNGLDDDYSWQVVKLLQEFPAITERAFDQHDPSQVAKYVINLSQAFNKFYGNVKILEDKENLDVKLSLVYCVTLVLKEGLRLLGINAPAEM
jgi:arginyl-tRNA synthetase